MLHYITLFVFTGTYLDKITSRPEDRKKKETNSVLYSCTRLYVLEQNNNHHQPHQEQSMNSDSVQGSDFLSKKNETKLATKIKQRKESNNENKYDRETLPSTSIKRPGVAITI